MNKTKYLWIGLCTFTIIFVSLYFSSLINENYQNIKTNYSGVITSSNETYLLNNANTPGPATFSQTEVGINAKDQFTDNSALRYNPDNLNIEYHDPSSDIKNNGIDDTQFSEITVKDACGNIAYLPNNGTQGFSTYHKPYSFLYGPSTYVPNYEDSVYLSRTTGLSTLSPVKDTVSMKGGFCKQNANFPDLLEQGCNILDKNVCASTSCCVLLGGEKCVSGGEQGVTMKSNYNEPSITNKDMYYYQGKCYGNC